MKKRILLSLVKLILVYMILGLSTANADYITFTPVVIGCAMDKEFDGNFETIYNGLATSETTIGRVMPPSMHQSERRAILEYDISMLPDDIYITKAKLIMGWGSGSNTTPRTNIYGYVGNGMLEASDALQTNNLIAGGLSTLWPVNVTSFLQALVTNSNRYAGILGVETVNDANRNYGYFPLQISYSSIPEPATLLLLGLGGLFLRKRK